MSTLAQASTWWGRNVRLMLRNPAGVGGAVMTPAVFLLCFTALFDRILAAQGLDAGQRLPPAVLVQGLMAAGTGAGVLAAIDARTGMVARSRALPVSRASVFLGRLGADALRFLLTTAALLLVGALLGFGFHGGALDVVAFVALALLFGTAYATACIWLGFATRDEEIVMSILALPFLLLFMLSSGIVPAERFPDWIEPLIRESPISRTIEALRALAEGGDVAATLPVAVAWLVGLTALGGAGAVRAYGRTS